MLTRRIRLSSVVLFAPPLAGEGRGPVRALIGAGLVALGLLPGLAQAADLPPFDQPEARVQAILPDFEAYLTKGMKAFDVPGVAVAIATGERTIYAKGFGVRGKDDGRPVDSSTVFQIGSATKAILGTTMAMMVDRGKLKWDARVVDLDPDFQLSDPWVTREFRVYDLIAQRSGLPPYANDMLSALGYGPDALKRSLRTVEPVSSFRSQFAYTNITHLFAGDIVAKAAGDKSWNDTAKREIVDSLDMPSTSFTAAAIEAAPDHATGHAWRPEGSKPIPFDPAFPYVLGPAGNVNSSAADMAKWVRLQLGDGFFERKPVVSAQNLAYQRTPKVAINETMSYALGWVVTAMPGGRVLWHNGGTNGFGAHVGLLPERGVGIVILTNEQNQGFPDAVATWFYQRYLGEDPTDWVDRALTTARVRASEDEQNLVAPSAPAPLPAASDVAGHYTNPALGTLELAADGDGLAMRLEETGAVLTLKPWSGAVYTFALKPEGRFAVTAAQGDTGPAGFAQFVMDKTGRLSDLEWKMAGQSFTFTRVD
ncbi:serine hydrolase [Segnochrobactrum spirostomi]|uniref:Serine hydrolase n=1 Tax=Segnochrobactrum spirostomi TaxID=2608987 RepID=A0A6A7Y0F8_9HYPH|nr:serine hydrolase [Segnochrobactrum spirostomi]MQT12414.1 serine hydrolase [Segnochrobactrum spirostomi]